MIKIVDIAYKPQTESDDLFGGFGFPEYPELDPDDILFAYCSGPGSQGEKSNYIITYTGIVYRVSIFELGSDGFMERVCPFLTGWDYSTMPDLEHLLKPDKRFAFKRNDWCWIGLCGSNSLFIHASMAADFARETENFNDLEMYHRWREVAIGLVKKMIEDINGPINKEIMFENTSIYRFIEAQGMPYSGYKQALEEIRSGKKTSHWIWYIFPQPRCLGRSSMAHYYGIADKAEAERYLDHVLLGERIREITRVLLEHKDKTALSIFGEVDAMKVRSCMTMFDFLSPNDIFGEVLDSFYKGERCEITLEIMQQEI